MPAVTPERGEGLTAEPVAWRVRAGDDQSWLLEYYRPHDDLAWPQVQPLYTRPAPSPATDEVVAVLRELVEINEQHNAAVEKVIGRPVGWKDSYLDRARSLLAKLEVRG